MKIITNDKAYVQKNDIGYLNSTDLPIPASIFIKVFGGGITIIDNSNRYEFVEFNEKSEVEFFKNIDWMIDYYEVKDLNEEEIISYAENIGKEQQEIARTFNSMSLEDKKKNADMITRCKLLEFKFYSLRDYNWFRKGHISMKLPDGIDYPEGAEIEKPHVKEKRLKNIFKRRRKKSED